MIVCGKVEEVLPGMPAERFDAALCDPPYGLGFMGKAWDHGIPSAEVWREVWRVLKPGAFLMAFGGTRTVHRLACAIEDAGFEIRDQLLWLYGSGLAKGQDQAKAARILRRGWRGDAVSNERMLDPLPERLQWLRQERSFEGYNTNLKPAHEPIIVAMKPCAGTFSANALEHGVGGLNIDGGRIDGPKSGGSGSPPFKFRGDNARPFHDGAKPTGENFDQSAGRWPANVALTHLPECREDCAPGCPVAMLDEQAGERPSGKLTPDNQIRGGFAGRDPNCYGTAARGGLGSYEANTGGPSRFFYCGKVTTEERNMGGATNCDHPTLKPIVLCKWLATLLLPPKREDGTPRRLLVPYSGAGSEMIGADRAGWDEVVGLEMDPASVAQAKARRNAPAAIAAKPRAAAPISGPLFD